MTLDPQSASLLHDYGPAGVAFFGFLLNGFLIYGSNRERKGEYSAQFAALAHWKDKHEQESDQRDKGIAELQKIAATSASAAVFMQKNLELIQEELRDNRNNRETTTVISRKVKR